MPDVGEIAGIIALVACPIYVHDILRGVTRPNRATWWIITLVGCLIAASYWESSSSTGSLALAQRSVSVCGGLLSLRFCVLPYRPYRHPVTWARTDSSVFSVRSNLPCHHGSRPCIHCTVGYYELDGGTKWVNRLAQGSSGA